MKSSFRFSVFVLFSSLIIVLFFSLYINQTEAGSEGGETLTKYDYLKWVGREVDLTWACTYYDSNYAATADVNTLRTAEKSIKWVNKEYVNGEGYWEALTDYIVELPVYGTEEVCSLEVVRNDCKNKITNETIEGCTPEETEVETCYDTTAQSGTREVTRQQWEPYDWNRNAKHLRFCAKLKPVLGERKIEHIPVMFGYEFDEYDWWSGSDWQSRMQIEINHTNATSLINFPVNISINTSELYNRGNPDIRIDCEDIRFLSDCGNTPDELYFWNESCVTNVTSGGNSSFWVNVTVPTTGSTICMYYDNPNATASSYMNGHRVFMIWDDFESYSNTSELLEEWTQMGGASVTLEESIYNSGGKSMNASGAEFARVRKNITGPVQTNGVYLRYWVRDSGVYDSHYLHWLGEGDDYNPACPNWVILWGYPFSGRIQFRSTYDTPTAHCLADTWNQTELYYNKSVNQVWSYFGTDDSRETIVINGSTSGAKDLFTLIFEERRGYYSQYIDDVMVRPWINPEPTVTIRKEETQDIATESEGRNAIKAGINSELPDADTYYDQHIYLRHADGNQQDGAFDLVAIEGNQTWAFNYLTTGDENPQTNMTNLSTVVYIWEMSDLNVSQITDQVEDLINLTKYRE